MVAPPHHGCSGGLFFITDPAGSDVLVEFGSSPLLSVEGLRYHWWLDDYFLRDSHVRVALHSRPTTEFGDDT